MPACGAYGRGSIPAPCFLIISFFRLRKKLQVPGAIPAVNAMLQSSVNLVTHFCIKRANEKQQRPDSWRGCLYINHLFYPRLLTFFIE